MNLVLLFHQQQHQQKCNTMISVMVSKHLPVLERHQVHLLELVESKIWKIQSFLLRSTRNWNQMDVDGVYLFTVHHSVDVLEAQWKLKLCPNTRAAEISPLVRTHSKLQLEKGYPNEIEKAFTNQQLDLYHAKMQNTASSGDQRWPLVMTNFLLMTSNDPNCRRGQI